MSAGTVTFQSPPPPKTLLERLRDDLDRHSREYHHVTPTALLAELEAAITEERLAGHLQSIAATLAAAQAAKTPAPSRFVEVKMEGGNPGRRYLVAIDTIESIQYAPWCVVLYVRTYTVDHRPTHVTYHRTFDTEEKPDEAAAAFIALCTRTR